jgi:DNA-binding MarR family transcriptional regulator
MIIFDNYFGIGLRGFPQSPRTDGTRGVSNLAKHLSKPATEDAPDEGMLSEHVGFRVHIAHRAIRRALRDHASMSRHDSLPSGSISALELISRNPGIGPHALAEILVLDRPKVTVLLRHLTDAGLVDRLPSDTDGRKMELQLTEAGRHRLAASREFSEFQERRIAQGLSAAERKQLNRLLRKLQDTLK